MLTTREKAKEVLQLYDGHNLVEKYPDLVLVKAEYRTGLMGFIDFSEVKGVKLS